METQGKQHDSQSPTGMPFKGVPQTIEHSNTQEIALLKEAAPIPPVLQHPDKTPVTEPALTPLRLPPSHDGLPHLERYATTPCIDLETTIVETLVPAMTLRAWERRYGIPVSQHSNGYRQYSPRDLAALKWLRWRIQQNDTSVYMAMTELASFEPEYVRQHGEDTPLESIIPPPQCKLYDLRDGLLRAVTSMDEAGAERVMSTAFAAHPAAFVCKQLLQPILIRLVEMRHTSALPRSVELFASKLTRSQIVHLIDAGMTPREALQRLSNLEAQAPLLYTKELEARQRLNAAPPLERIRDVMLEAIMRLDEAHTQSILDEALFYYPVEEVCLDLLQPVLYRLGDLWAARQITVMVEHFATNIIRTRLSHIFQTTPNLRQGPAILVGCAPREAHEMGALMLALFWRRSGLNVYYLGQMVEGPSLVQEIRRTRPGLVCLSATTRASARDLAEVAREIEKIDKPRPIVCFGGSIFTQEPGLIKTIKGVFLGSGALNATRQIQELVQPGTAHHILANLDL